MAYKSVFRFVQFLLRSVVGTWSLERKSLLFLGVALVVPIGLSFWFVLQVVADRLVMQTTRQAARDYARAAIAWEHSANMPRSSVFPGASDGVSFDAQTSALLRIHLVDNPEYSKPEYLMLEQTEQFRGFAKSRRPVDEFEEKFLSELEVSYRQNLRRLDDASQAAIADAIALREGQAAEPAADANSGLEALTKDEIRAILDADVSVQGIQKSLGMLYRDEGPFFPAGEELIRLQNTGIIERTPPSGWFVYYHAIHFSEGCYECHSRFSGSQAEKIPFRAVKVLIPYSQTQVASTTTLAIMIAVAMVTVAATLLVVHWVFKRLVLNPLKHLQSVSDEIGRGNTDLRANIDTGDEFNELADAFNRMLRNVTDDQEKLLTLNRELDIKVDELAQANFNLYEANRLKSDFLANMSHELRTPLNSIIGFSDVIRDIDSLSEKQRKYADNIQSSGKVLLDMINEILDLAKIEAGKMQVSPTAFDIVELVRNQCATLQPLVDEKNVDLQIEPATAELEVFQDRAKLQQILTNLLSNAIKFTPDGGIIIVRMACVEDALISEAQSELSRRGECFYIEVEDTGVGIPESDFEIIFEKFRQSNEVLQNDGLTRQYAGTGLGLSIVKELCKLLGGEIQLSSQLGTGSTFRVILPVHYQVNAVQELDA